MKNGQKGGKGGKDQYLKTDVKQVMIKSKMFILTQ